MVQAQLRWSMRASPEQRVHSLSGAQPKKTFLPTVQLSGLSAGPTDGSPHEIMMTWFWPMLLMSVHSMPLG